MITPDNTGKFGASLLTKFKELIETGVLKLMAGNPNAPAATIESAQPLATLPVTSLKLEVANGQLRMATATDTTKTPKFTVLQPGTITWFMLDCRQLDIPRAPNNGYIKGDVSFTGSSSVLREAAELQLNTLLISAGDGGALSEITPVQFSIRLG